MLDVPCGIVDLLNWLYLSLRSGYQCQQRKVILHVLWPIKFRSVDCWEKHNSNSFSSVFSWTLQNTCYFRSRLSMDVQAGAGAMPISAKGQASSTAHLSSTELGQWNTTTRLLATLLNDHMITATPRSVRDEPGLLLHGTRESSEPQSPAVWVALSEAGQLRLITHNSKNNAAVFPGDFAPPAVITTFGAPETGSDLNLHPASLFNHLRSVLSVPPVDDDRWDEICRELTNSAENGRYWSDWYSHRKALSFKSTRLEWEQALYTGHPLHPVSQSLQRCNAAAIKKQKWPCRTFTQNTNSNKGSYRCTAASELKNACLPSFPRTSRL